MRKNNRIKLQKGGLIQTMVWQGQVRQGSGPTAKKETKSSKKVSTRTIPLFWTVLYHNIFKEEHNFQRARILVQLLPSSPAILSEENQLGKNEPEPPDSSRSYGTCQSRKHRAARLWQGLPQSCAPQLFVLNLYPTAPSSVGFCNSTLAWSSL